MALDASLNTALQGAAPLVCLLLKIELPAGDVRLIDGAGEIVFNGETYLGKHSLYGTLDMIESMNEEVGTEAPMVRISVLPESLSAFASITNPLNQGSRVRIWFGAVNPTTGALIGQPELLFLGEIDTADAEVGRNNTRISFNVGSAWERLFDANEAQRLNNAFIQSVYPGALGASFVIAVQRDLPWGYDAARPAVVSDVIGGRTNTGGTAVGGGFAGGGGGGGSIDGGFGVLF
jgi:hypothetical protein